MDLHNRSTKWEVYLYPREKEPLEFIIQRSKYIMIVYKPGIRVESVYTPFVWQNGIILMVYSY